MRWLVTGATGMLGTDAYEVLTGRGFEVTAVGRSDLDVCDREAVGRAVAGHDVVLNCAAWTAVDAAEEHESEAAAVNTVAAGILAGAARDAGARLLHVSTDYVFDGRATVPYSEDAPARPVSAYGRTKAAGEDLVRSAHPEGHLILRTAWLYGAHGVCFPRTIVRLARERGSVAVVDDQHGQPTWTVDVVDLAVRLVEADVPAGTHHATSRGETSWFRFAREALLSAGMDPSIVTPTDSASMVRPAPRPLWSVLGHDALHAVGVQPIGHWRDRWHEAADVVLAD